MSEVSSTGGLGDSMNVSDLIRHFPTLYHMAESGTWESVRARGLLSTSALLDLFEIRGEERRKIESERRPHSVTISHPQHGTAVIRDQKPMSESALLKCLKNGVSPSEWCQTLNNRVFFWLSKERLDRLLSARAYRDKQHCVLTVDSASLLAVHANSVTLSPINSGSTIFKPQPRGSSTFLRIADYPFEEWLAKRPIADAVVELVVDYAVKDIEKFVVKVEERKGDQILKLVHRR
jgi:hypothetical protein